ncbi:MAG: hypothetical protein O2960_10980 [Verrucomicrobia bacterium]|nr:hypothetical protein [Verrucomicrobiota bacterium]
MNNEEAKFILQAYRPSGQDAQDPQFAEALAQVQKDPELAVWFAQELALDKAIGAKIKQIPIPSDLRASIVAGKKVVQLQSRWNRRRFLALAAAVTLILSLSAWWFDSNRSNTFAGYRRSMTRMLTSDAINLQLTSENMANIKLWLAANEGHPDFILPDGMKGLPTFGCRILDWHGKKVTFICLQSDGLGMAHLFVINQSDIKDSPKTRSPEFMTTGKWCTASWSQGGKSYLLAGAGDHLALERLL